MLEALIRFALAGNVLASARSDDQTKSAARGVLADAIRQLRAWPEALAKAAADAGALLGMEGSSGPDWGDVLKVAHDFEANEPELAARAFAYVVRRSGEAATDQNKLSSDLVAAFQESQHKLLDFHRRGYCPRPDIQRIGARDVAVVDDREKDSQHRFQNQPRPRFFFKETATLLQLLSDSCPESADLLKYLTDALDWHSMAAIRGGTYAQLPLTERLGPIAAAERLVILDGEIGQDRVGEAAEIFFKQIWNTDADRRTLYGSFAADLSAANLIDVMQRVARNSPDLLYAESSDHNAVIRKFTEFLGTSG